MVSECGETTGQLVHNPAGMSQEFDGLAINVELFMRQLFRHTYYIVSFMREFLIDDG